jgi:PAS domain S-box-containing protein
MATLSPREGPVGGRQRGDATALRVLFHDILRVIGLALDLDGSEKLNHASRVAYLSYRIGAPLGLDLGTLFYAGLLHDLGGIGLEDHVIHHAASDFDDHDARKHSERGVHILRPFSLLRPLTPAILHHHERYDGHGFPFGLAERDIPREAAVLHAADLIELSLRGQPPTKRRARAIGVLQHAWGRAISPEVTDAALTLLDEEPQLIELLYDERQLDDLLGRLYPEPPGLENVGRSTLLAQLLWVLARVIDTKHPYTMGHSARVAHAGFQIARAIGDSVNAWDVVWAGLLHDVGKIGTPRRLLDKPGRLTDPEWQVVMRHATDSHRIVSGIRDLAHLAYPAAAHHERYDGKGYPSGASGEAIPLIARVLAYADVFDALTSTRSYRAALPAREALTKIRAMTGSALDPHLGTFALEALERLGAPGAQTPSFERFFEGDEADLDEGFGSESQSAPSLRISDSGALLLGLDRWVRVELDEVGQILGDTAPLARLLGSDTRSFAGGLDEDSARDYGIALARLTPGSTFTRYLFTTAGQPLEVVLLREAERTLLLCRSAANRIQSMDRLALIYRNFLRSSESVVLTDVAGRIIDANHAFVELFGWPPDELVGKRMNIVASGRQDAAYYGKMWAALTNPHVASWSDEITNRKRTGEEVPVRLTIESVRDASGNAIGYVGHLVDLTEKMQAERQLRETNDELVRVSRLKDELIAMTSHDLRGPLASMRSLAALMRDNLDRLSAEQHRSHLDRIEVSASELLTLVNDLLDLEKVESGNFVLQPCRIRLDAVLAACVEQAQARTTSSVRVALDIEGSPRPCVADPWRLAQVFTNLLSNAVKFAPSDSTIHARYREHEDRVVVDIEDAGPGLPEQELVVIFDRFYQVERKGSVPKRAFGTGLGLSIVRNLVTMHGGSVRATNLPGGGCRFSVELPVERAHPLLEQPLALVRASSRCAADVVEQLSAAGAAVFLVDSPFELAWLGAVAPADLIFLEEAVLDAQDHAVARKARSLKGGLPIIVCLVEDLAGCSGADRVLSTPLLDSELRELLSLVHQLRHEREAST